jgi:para-nitrobenzyl esterase
MSLKEAVTRYGTLRGVQKIGYTVFRGIPYAKPPVGSLRWKKPEAPERWEGLRDAKVFVSQAVQEGSPPGTFYHKEFFSDEDFFPPKSEDCLYLNIWTPAETPKEGLAAAFWIHGGAFINGFSTEMEFDGAAFARERVILVTVGYRLGALGYLAHPWLGAEDSGRSGNYGLYDLIAALDWVRDNIASFGGDPDRVTVFGQSAGAICTQALISSKLTRGKIHRAIIQSAGGYRSMIGRFIPRDRAEEKGRNFAAHCKVNSLEEFRKYPAEKLVGLQTTVFEEAMRKKAGLPFAPVIDGDLLEDDAAAILEEGGHLDIPYILGCTADDLGTPPDRIGRGDEPPLLESCRGFSFLNENLGRKPAYVYLFTRRPLGDNAGSFHSAELWYIFGTLGRSWRPKEPVDYEISQTMIRRWCAFIKTGDPNGEGLSPWKPCTKTDPFVMEF